MARTSSYIHTTKRCSQPTIAAICDEVYKPAASLSLLGSEPNERCQGPIRSFCKSFFFSYLTFLHCCRKKDLTENPG